MQLKLGETVYIPFRLFDATGAEVVDTTAGNYTFRLTRNGAVVAAPTIVVTNPSGNELLLAYTPTQSGVFAFGRLSHSTSGYETDILGGTFLVRASSVDDLLGQLAIPAATPTATTAVAGDEIFIVRNTDFAVTFQIFQADGVTPKDLTGYTFRFALGDRTADSDVRFYSQTGITAAAPATGQVSIAITDVNTGGAAFTSRIGSEVFYELEGTDGSGLITAFAIARASILRDIPEPA